MADLPQGCPNGMSRGLGKRVATDWERPMAEIKSAPYCGYKTL